MLSLASAHTRASPACECLVQFADAEQGPGVRALDRAKMNHSGSAIAMASASSARASAKIARASSGALSMARVVQHAAHPLQGQTQMQGILRLSGQA